MTGSAIPGESIDLQIADILSGVTYPLNKDLASAVNLPIDRGALVQDVTPGGPAYRAGLKPGKIHTDEEWLKVGTMVPRAQALALTAMRLFR